MNYSIEKKIWRIKYFKFVFEIDRQNNRNLSIHVDGNKLFSLSKHVDKNNSFSFVIEISHIRLRKIIAFNEFSKIEDCKKLFKIY